MFFFNLYSFFKKIEQISYKKKVLTIQSFEEYCLQNNNYYLIIKSSQQLKCYIPLMFEVDNFHRFVSLDSPDIYIAKLYSALVCGDNNFVICKDKYLSDIPFNQRAEIYNLEYGATSEIDFISKRAVVKYRNSKILIDKAISIVGAASNNYYHFTVDLLARLHYIDKFVEYDDYDLLIDERSLEYFPDLIKLINKKNRNVVPIKRGKSYKIKELVFPSFVSFNPIYINSEVNANNPPKYGNFYDIEPYLSFRNKISISNFSNQSNFAKKLFISRRDVVRNDLINEEEVEKVFVSIGFSVISPGKLDFYQQYMYFSQAEVIVGAEGAAFTNILYCKKKINIVCILDQHEKKYFVSNLGYILGHNIIYLAAQKTSKGKYHLDLDYLSRFISYKNYDIVI